MTTLKAQAPPVNLKERIAALQQRSVSPVPRATSPTPAPVTSPSSAGLRDKIARFEKKGGIPVPRGSFGLGAPPLAENGPAKRRGELYGNRIPGAVRASGGGPTTSRSASPFESPRSFSLSALDTDEVDTSAFDQPSLPAPSSPASPYLGPSVEHTGVPRGPAPRGTSFANALDIARRAESSGDASFGRLEAREASISPPPASHTPMPSLEPLIGDELGDLELQESPPAIVISSDENSNTPDLEPPDNDTTTTPHSTISSNPNTFSLPSDLPEGVEAVPTEVGLSGRQTPPVDTEVPTPVMTVIVEPTVSSARDNSMVEEAPTAPVLTEETDSPMSSDQASIPPQDSWNTKKSLPQIPPPSPDSVSAAISSGDLSTSLDFTEGVATSKGAPVEAIEVNLPAAPDDASVVEAATQDPENIADPPQEIEQLENDENSQKKAHPEEIEILSPDQMQSPAGPLTLADAVIALGQTVANIQGLFPDQTSPLATPPAYRSLHIDSAADHRIRSHRREESLSRDHKKPSVDLTVQVESPSDVVTSIAPVETASKPEEHFQCRVLLTTNNESSVTITESIPQTSDHPVAPEALPPTPDPHQHALLATPSVGGRPVSMIETSPSHVAQAHRATPLTSRGVPIFIPAVRGPQDFENFPPTPDQEETDFGTVSVHKQSHSFSHARTYVSHGQADTKNSSFKAVVHTKVTELPSSASMPVIPQTPQMNRTKRSIYGEVPPSPGYGELAALLQEAALLEETLEKGELPSEAVRQEALEKKRLGEQVAAERAAAEEKRMAGVRSKSREKRDEPEIKSKSSFGAMLRNKSSSRRDALSNEAPALSARDHARAKTVLYSHRPSQGSRQALGSQQMLETHDEVPHMDSDPHQTSPKSRQYFAGLRRLASTPRPSMGSSTHPRHSASTSSEISSEDSVSVVTPPDGSLDSAGSGNGVSWPSLSPKKNGGVSRAASFAEKMWSRGRTKSTISTKSAYETIERITQSTTGAIPPLEPISFSLDVPMIMQTSPPSPIEEHVSPRRSASFHVRSTPQFPPTYSPTPTSPVYTPFTASAPRLDDIFQPLQINGLSPEPKEDIRPISWMSEASTSSLIPSPLFDSFPAVPQDPPPRTTAGFSHMQGHTRNAPRPSLPLSVPSFFDSTPLSSTPVGSESTSNPSSFLRSASTSTPRPVTMPPQSSVGQYR